MEYTISEVLPQTAFVASQTIEHDLGVQALSYLWFAVSGQQTGGITGTSPTMLLDALSEITVSNLGATVWGGSGRDLARMAALVTGWPTFWHIGDQVAAPEAVVEFILPFGRYPFHPTEGFPSTRRGELTLSVVTASGFTNFSALHLTVQQVELPGARMTRYNKVTSRGTTPTATGDWDVPLSIGNRLRGVLIAETTPYVDTVMPGTARGAKLLVNNTEHYWTGGALGHLRTMFAWRARAGADLLQAAHVENLALAYTQNVDTNVGWSEMAGWEHGYAYMDLDPTQDDTYTLDTKGLSDLRLRLDIASAQAVRVLSYESVQVA